MSTGAILGVAEIAALLNVTKQAVANWRARDNAFPKPIADLKAGPVWLQETIVAWAQAQGMRVKLEKKLSTERTQAAVISVVNAKGGVGKTTLTQNLGWYCYRRLHKRVLLVDLDPQFNLSQIALGSEEYGTLIKNGEATVTSIFSQDVGGIRQAKKLGKDVVHHLRAFRSSTGKTAKLDIIPSDLNLAWSVRDGYAKNDLLSNFLTHTLGRDSYDVVLIDCPPTDSVLTDAAYAASDYVLIPVKPDFLSAVGLPLIDRSIERFRSLKPEHKVEVLGVVINGMIEGKDESVRSRVDIKRAAKQFNWNVFPQELSFSDSYPKGARLGTPIFMTDYARWEKKLEFESFADQFAKQVRL